MDVVVDVAVDVAVGEEVGEEVDESVDEDVRRVETRALLKIIPIVCLFISSATLTYLVLLVDYKLNRES